MDLSTRYLGFDLPHPFMAGASPLTATLDGALRLEQAGASALVLPSLFEEQIDAAEGRDLVNGPAAARAVRTDYLRYVSQLRARTRLPVIASLNGTTAASWLHGVSDLERAGAQAIELNFYHVAANPGDDATAIERRLVDIVAVLKESVRIPVAVKLSPFFTSLPNVAVQLERIGADGLVLFNRFYQADLDPNLCAFVPGVRLSNSSDLLLRLHAVASLAGRVRLSLAITGGVHAPIDGVKALMAGADAVQLTSAILRHGPAHLTRILRRVSRWAAQHGYRSLPELHGKARITGDVDPEGLERRDYVQALQQWGQIA